MALCKPDIACKLYPHASKHGASFDLSFVSFEVEGVDVLPGKEERRRKKFPAVIFRVLSMLFPSCALGINFFFYVRICAGQCNFAHGARDGHKLGAHTQ